MAATSKRRGRPRRAITPESERAYQPTEVVQAEGDEEQDDDWEVGALVWGLVSMVGLGTASAGVFGAETTAR